MNKIAISMLLLTSATAFAGTGELSRTGDIDAAPLQPQAALVTDRTRADVTAEYIRARNEGTLAIVGDTAPMQSPVVTQGVSRDRDTVKAEAVQASRAYVYHEL
jgi:hypothetical protein